MAHPAPAESAVAASLEIYESRHGDPTPAIYQRFFVAHPDAEELFAGDTLLPRRMMAGILGIILDLADGTLDPDHSTTWVADHVAYEVTGPMLDGLLAAVVDEIRAGLGDDWTDQTQEHWSAVLDTWADRALAEYRRHSDA